MRIVCDVQTPSGTARGETHTPQVQAPSTCASMAVSHRRRSFWPYLRHAVLMPRCLAKLGDALPADKLKAMFEAVDTNADGKIEYVKFYKSVVDEAMGVEPESGGGGGGGFSFGSLFGKK